MNKKSCKICILGGGFGGLYTALYLSNSALVKSGKCEITLVEPKENFLFTPLLYEILTNELQRSHIAPSYQKLLRKTPINFCQEKVKRINLEAHQVSLENGEQLDYDYLVLAVGNKNKPLNIKGASQALYFRTLADAELLDERLKLLELSERQCLRIAIVGGGPNGVELACKVSDRLGERGQVTIIDRSRELLKPFSQGIKAATARALRARQIQVFYESQLTSINGESITIEQYQQTFNLPVDLVLWTAGTEARSWIANLNVPQTPQGKLITKPTLQLLDYPEVFALGDLAQINYSKFKAVPATAQAAYQQATIAAKNLEAIIKGQKLRAFHYLHLGDMLTLGKKAAVVSSFGLNFEGALADKIRRLVYIQRLPTWGHRFYVLQNVAQKSLLTKWRFLTWQLSKILTPKSVKSYQKDI